MTKRTFLDGLVELVDTEWRINDPSAAPAPTPRADQFGSMMPVEFIGGGGAGGSASGYPSVAAGGSAGTYSPGQGGVFVGSATFGGGVGRSRIPMETIVVIHPPAGAEYVTVGMSRGGKS